MTVVCRVIIAATFVFAAGLLCTGCGTSFPTNEMEIVLTDLPKGIRPEDCVVVISQEFLDKDKVLTKTDQVHRAGPDGRITFDYRCTAATWLWQRRPSRLDFNLYLPDLWTNGWYNLTLQKLRGTAMPVEGRLWKFESWWKDRPALEPVMHFWRRAIGA